MGRSSPKQESILSHIIMVTVKYICLVLFASESCPTRFNIDVLNIATSKTFSPKSQVIHTYQLVPKS